MAVSETIREPQAPPPDFRGSLIESQGAFRLASRAEKLKRPAKLWLLATRRAVRGALTHEAFFDLPSLSPPCKQSRESSTIAGGSGDWQTLALVFSIIATTSFSFAAVRTGSTIVLYRPTQRTPKQYKTYKLSIVRGRP